jgi:hypothetical protein
MSYSNSNHLPAAFPILISELQNGLKNKISLSGLRQESRRRRRKQEHCGKEMAQPAAGDPENICPVAAF